MKDRCTVFASPAKKGCAAAYAISPSKNRSKALSIDYGTAMLLEEAIQGDRNRSLFPPLRCDSGVSSCFVRPRLLQQLAVTESSSIARLQPEEVSVTRNWCSSPSLTEHKPAQESNRTGGLKPPSVPPWTIPSSNIATFRAN